MRLLVVEDNPKLAGLIEHAFAVDVAPTAADGRAALGAEWRLLGDNLQKAAVRRHECDATARRLGDQRM
jgi:hypothetical protein